MVAEKGHSIGHCKLEDGNGSLQLQWKSAIEVHNRNGSLQSECNTITRDRARAMASASV